MALVMMKVLIKKVIELVIISPKQQKGSPAVCLPPLVA